MSVKDSETTLENSIESILNQTYTDYNFLICDDGSNDETKRILEKYHKMDQRIVIYKNQENVGLTRSLNRLLKYSDRKYIARQDADDISDKNRLKIQLSFLENSSYGVCTTRSKDIDSMRPIPGISYYFPKKFVMRYKNPFIHGSLLIESKILSDIGFYDEKFFFAQDYKLFYDLYLQGYNIATLNKFLYFLNTKNNISTNHFQEQKKYSDEVKYLIRKDF
jgi:glycosyltransferase EpsE